MAEQEGTAPPLGQGPRAARRRPRALPRALLAGVVTLLALEGCARLAARALHRERGQLFDSELGWRPAPDLRKRGEFWGRAAIAFTNSRGWRDDEAPFARRPGVRRIVAVGDSFTFGIGVDHGERYTELLERSLPRLEVINLGVNAYGTDQELRALEVEGLRYGPDLVLLQACLVNDLDDICHRRRFGWPRPHYELRDGRLSLNPPRATWDVRLRTRSYLVELLLRGRDRLDPRRRDQRTGRTDAVPLFVALVRRVDEVSRGRGARLLVAMIGATPIPGDRERIHAGLEAAGIEFVDLDAELARSMARSEVLYEGTHWSPAGHRRVAQILAGEIVRRGGLPAVTDGAPAEDATVSMGRKGAGA
jgi:hypothetical protein